MDRKAGIIRKLQNFKKQVDSDFFLKKMYFFGSRASGKPRRDSDIDLILVSSRFKKLDFIERGAKMYDYWNLHYPVDFLCYTPEEFERKKKLVGIVQQAVKEGIEIKVN